MLGKKLIKQIIIDLQSCIIAASNSRTLEEIKLDVLFHSGKFTKSNINFSESYIAISCEISIPYKGTALLRLFSKFSTLVSLQKSEVLSLDELIEIFQHYENILSETLQELADKTNFMAFPQEDTQETVFEYIKSQIDDFHKESQSIAVAYSSQNKKNV